MKSWIHEIAESYIAGHKPVRRDLKENYTSLTEKERFNLLSDNITSYFNEQIKNAYGFSLNDITQEQAGTLLKSLFEEGVGKYDGPAPDEGSTVVPGHPDYIERDKPTTKSIRRNLEKKHAKFIKDTRDSVSGSDEMDGESDGG